MSFASPNLHLNEEISVKAKNEGSSYLPNIALLNILAEEPVWLPIPQSGS